MKASELRQTSDEELNTELLNLSREAFSLRMQAGTGQLTRFHQVKEVRRDIARIKTVLNERREGEQA